MFRIIVLGDARRVSIFYSIFCVSCRSKADVTHDRIRRLFPRGLCAIARHLCSAKQILFHCLRSVCTKREQKLSYCWDGCTLLQKSNCHIRVEVPHFNEHFLSNLKEYCRKITAEFCVLHFSGRQHYFDHCDVSWYKVTELGDMTKKNGRYAKVIQGHRFQNQRKASVRLAMCE